MAQRMEYEVVREWAASRYEARTPDGTVVGIAEYVLAEGTIELPHTVVPTEFEGQGIASALARAALRDARDGELKVIPTCWFIDSYIERHPEYWDLVSRG
ncbi:N-acetyltransferase [Paraoerskovia sediminicola]|uniref:N-acetyltransferase n=1 Tax=Paraoerskovia sediminicola TaxID=1138587 RepID=A0ABM8G2V2_9CELL|nr:GNAT family N-acetyltransferase [Paraoerskovia sediminicola]BDZ42338.1 N-acetyltransferase [Paraoerskovia sediminicola]